ncbi:dimethylarginine dimethylaminohydrolase family protein [Edaphobacter bradus]|uniref:dimethylarginine dimethylaminohydrolase family protein n=1 Tax=Edaphobacter bradus TaxID=2259016 RepID=UPI0021E029CD|nr:arginine deiminase-related protein [Edaphobacter bradus]
MSTRPIEITSALPPLVTARRTYLMCPPTLYDVDYVINPWMSGNVHLSSRERAIEQWNHLYRELTAIADVELIQPQSGSPDMVFTANAGLERNGTVVLSGFFHPERQAEEHHFRSWFQSSGYNVLEVPREIPFEGEGDALFSSEGTRLWAAHGPRSVMASHTHLVRAWGVEVIALHLVDPRFYHLDTCFAPLEDGFVMYYPQAFDAPSLVKIEAFYPSEKRIVVSEADAVRFACNAINIDRTILVNDISRELVAELQTKGFEVIQITLSEFLKAGGAAKCLVMRLGPQIER